MNEVKRLAVRIPVVGWEADIATEDSGHIQAKIVNISADGAYLMTKQEFKPGSSITMLVKSHLICFHAKATVTRNDTYGIGVHFIDLGGLSRNLILNLISKFLAQSVHKKASAVKYRDLAESQLELNC